MSIRVRLLLTSIALLVLATRPALAAPTPATTFQQLWERYDRPVANQTSGRSWTWGPAPDTDVFEETFTGGARMVQYYDKGRMEINDPNADPASPWFVTSGLLPEELMLGDMQGATSWPRYRESYITAVGDPGNFPTYPDLQPLYQNPGQLDPNRLGKPVTDLLQPDETIASFTAYQNDPATVLVAGANNHGIPQAFATFQTQQGLVFEHERFVQQQVYDPLFIFGLPITPAVWVNATLGGTQQPVLFQVFERRVLTYTPSNPLAFRVEMGNVGQHYQQWRYQPDTAKEWGPWDWDTHEVHTLVDGGGTYTLAVEWHNTNPPPGASRRMGHYTITFTPDGSQTSEVRSTGNVGGCHYSNIALLPPHDPHAPATKIGLATQCADNPSESRGTGVTLLASYDGGHTFLGRTSY